MLVYSWWSFRTTETLWIFNKMEYLSTSVTYVRRLFVFVTLWDKRRNINQFCATRQSLFYSFGIYLKPSLFPGFCVKSITEISKWMEFLTVLAVKITALGEVKSTYSGRNVLILGGTLLYMKIEIRFLRIFGTHRPDYTASHLRKRWP